MRNYGHHWRNGIAATLFAAVLLGGATMAGAEEATKEVKVTYPVLAEGQKSGDRRVTETKTLKTVQSFKAPRFFGDWKRRKDHMRNRVLASCGLLPLPEKGELKYEIFDRMEMDGYSVEKVLLQTFPGYYATGNLYRPLASGTYPGILCPHGHWGMGRREDSDRASVPRRAASFAKQGYVCFSTDMVGYQDNGTFLPHGIEGDREAIWGISSAGVQLWTSIRALDFLESLPGVDADRLGCTGASGGGTQTFLLTAVDDRVKVSAPVNMISSTMQGGCICENAPMLRLDSNNMEIGALMAPRPLCLIAATGDWTKLTPSVEYPAIRSVYELYGTPQRVMVHQEDCGHNYNLDSRQVVYKWFRKWFYPNRPANRFVESADLVVPTSAELAIFPGREKPADALEPDDFYAAMRKTSESRLLKALEGESKEFHETYGVAYRHVMTPSELNPKDIKTERFVSHDSPDGSWRLETFLLTHKHTGQEIPAHLWLPSATAAAGKKKEDRVPVLVIHPEGKSGLVSGDGTPGDTISAYLETGRPALSIDCLKTGEFVGDASAMARADKENLSTTYNLTDTACRVQDILLGETFLRKRFEQAADLVGLPGAGAEVALAHGLARGTRSSTADLSGLDFEGDACFLEALYVPNLKKVGDFATSIVLGGKREIEIVGLPEGPMKERLAKARALAQK